MRIRRLILPTALTICTALLVWWILSVYIRIAPVQNAPNVTTQFDGEQAMQYLHSLTHQFKGRVMGSVQGFAAADYVAGQFRSCGLKVETQDIRQAGWRKDKGQNVIGILPGQESGTVIFTAHRDCVPDAPEGAYDNGSGTAAVLELARVLAASGPHRYTYVFVSLDGEEIGQIGARVLMNNRPSALKVIRLMVNLDMVGFKESNELDISRMHYLSPEARALMASHFSLPSLGPLQNPFGNGMNTDARIYVRWGLPTLDITDIRPMSVKIGYHNAEDT